MGSALIENQQQDRLPVSSTPGHRQQEKLSLGSLGSSHRTLPFNSDSSDPRYIYALERQSTPLHPQNHDEISFYKTQELGSVSHL